MEEVPQFGHGGYIGSVSGPLWVYCRDVFQSRRIAVPVLDVVSLAPVIEVCVLLRLDHGGGWIWMFLHPVVPCFNGIYLAGPGIVVHFFPFADRLAGQSASAGVLGGYFYYMFHGLIVVNCVND